MPWKNPEGVIEYRDPSWEAESYWIFKDHQTQRDKDAQMKRMSVQDFEYDPQEERRMRRQGKKYFPKITADTKMSGLVAMIVQQSRGWFGEEFRLPEDWVVPGSQDRDPRTGRIIPGTGTPHPQRGQIPPCTLDFILERDPEELKRIESFLNDIYEPMEDSEAEEFPGGSESLDGPGDSGFSTGRVPVSIGDIRSQADEGPALESR